MTLHLLLFLVIGITCLSPYVSAGFALLAGLLLSLVFGNTYSATTRRLTAPLLQLAVVGLGAGMNLRTVAATGVSGIGYTAIGIMLTLLIGTVLGKWLGTGRDATILITVGTAICGGSAIAAVAPAIRAKAQDVTVALGVVFTLNAIALWIFPSIGHALLLSQAQFGLWCALAIHDTSSVVGAALQYGPQAVQIATTVKLARALWIVPLVFAIGWSPWKSAEPTHTKKPWFILGFLLLAALVTWIPALQPVGVVINAAAKRLLVLTLFLIGTGLTLETLRTVGTRPLVLGIALWMIAASTTLAAISFDLIR